MKQGVSRRNMDWLRAIDLPSPQESAGVLSSLAFGQLEGLSCEPFVRSSRPYLSGNYVGQRYERVGRQHEEAVHFTLHHIQGALRHHTHTPDLLHSIRAAIGQPRVLLR